MKKHYIFLLLIVLNARSAIEWDFTELSRESQSHQEYVLQIKKAIDSFCDLSSKEKNALSVKEVDDSFGVIHLAIQKIKGISPPSYWLDIKIKIRNSTDLKSTISELKTDYFDDLKGRCTVFLMDSDPNKLTPLSVPLNSNDSVTRSNAVPNFSSDFSVSNEVPPASTFDSTVYHIVLSNCKKDTAASLLRTLNELGKLINKFSNNPDMDTIQNISMRLEWVVECLLYKADHDTFKCYRNIEIPIEGNLNKISNLYRLEARPLKINFSDFLNRQDIQQKMEEIRQAFVGLSDYIDQLSAACNQIIGKEELEIDSITSPAVQSPSTTPSNMPSKSKDQLAQSNILLSQATVNNQPASNPMHPKKSAHSWFEGRIFRWIVAPAILAILCGISVHYCLKNYLANVIS